MKIDHLTFDLGRTKCCPVSYTSCDLYYTAAKVEVAIYMKIIYLTFSLDHEMLPSILYIM